MSFTPTLSPVSARGDLLQRARAREELERRAREGGVRYFQPINAAQEAALRFTSSGALILGGNRAGKTMVGGAEAAYRLLGEHPYKRVHRAPIKLWACSQDLPGKVRAKGDEDQEVHKQLEMLKLLIPRDALRGGAWGKAYSPSEYTISLRNGSMVEFKAYSQGPLQFESDAIHDVWFDEEPPDRQIFTSSLMRLADYDGQWWMTVTPILSLQGQGWIEELWEKRADPHCGYETFQLFTTENSALPQERVAELFSQLTDEERQVRAYGAFARLGGRVLSEYDPRRHDFEDFIPPPEWKHRLWIDPGWAIGAHLFNAEDPERDIWNYAEHYQGQRTPKQHLRVCDGIYKAFGAPPIRIYMDPAGFSIKRTTYGKESPSDADEYMAAARELGLTWFRGIVAADNGDPYAWRLKRYLANGRWHVARSLSFWRWEQERWTRQKERKTVSAMEHAVPDAPIDRFNHLMDLSRYTVNEIGEPRPPRDDDDGPDLERVAGHRRRRQQDPHDPQLSP